ncbi:MAG: multifunctional CCA addition/repair protein [Betaproteobacteria bacterium]
MARRYRKSPSVKVYRVGGSVRDELLDRAVADRDWVVVGATPEMLIASGYKPVGRDFPVFLHPETREEYALARTERKHGRGYRGFEFFVSPDVTLEEDLARRDLTINAMARDEQGALIDPFGGRADLGAGILRHVSPAFSEDPLRVLRVARFAARFAFTVAPETLALMRALARSGELAELAPERVWQEVARGLMEPHPSKMIHVLRDCGALSRLLPEVDALYRAKGTVQVPGGTGARLDAMLDLAARRSLPLPVRYAVLAHDLAIAAAGRDLVTKRRTAVARSVRLAEGMSQRLKVPADCRDAARVAARWCRVVDQADGLPPARLLGLFAGTDALRRPERLQHVLDVGACRALSRPGSGNSYPPARIVLEALDAVRRVDAGAVAAIARGAPQKARPGEADGDERIAKAVRAARLQALRHWRLRSTNSRKGA